MVGTSILKDPGIPIDEIPLNPIRSIPFHEIPVPGDPSVESHEFFR